jgi:hypothetical protein
MGILDTRVDAQVSVDTEFVNALGAREALSSAGKKVTVKGTIEGAFQTGQMLAYALGVDVQSGAGPYTHYMNYKTAAAAPVEIATLPSFTMSVTRGYNSANYTVETYTGCRINQLQFKTTLDEVATVTIDFIAQNVSTVYSSGTESPIHSANELHPLQYQSMKIAGTAVNEVQGWTLTINNNLQAIYEQGNQLIVDLVNGKLDIDVQGTVIYASDENWQWSNITNTSTPFTFGGVASQQAPTLSTAIVLISSNGAASTASRSLTVALTNAAITELDPSGQANNVTMMDFKATARDFLQTNWGTSPTGAPIIWVDDTNSGAYVSGTQ